MSTKSSIYYATDGDYYVHVYNECFDNNNQVHIEAWYYDTDNELYSETLTLTEGLWVALLQEIKTHLEPYLDDAQAEVKRLEINYADRIRKYHIEYESQVRDLTAEVERLKKDILAREMAVSVEFNNLRELLTESCGSISAKAAILKIFSNFIKEVK